MLGQLFRLSSSTGDNMSFWIRRFLNCHSANYGNIVDCGTSYVFSFFDDKLISAYNQVLVRLSLTGDTLNMKLNTSQYDNFGCQIDKNSSNEIISVGSNSGILGNIKRYSEDLNTLTYSRNYGSSAPYALNPASFVSVGDSVTILDNNAQLADFNMSTNVQNWKNTYTTGTSPTYRFVTKDSSGNLYLQGTSQSTVVCSIVVKLNNIGTPIWTRGVKGASGNVTTMYNYATSVDSSGNVYSTGLALTNTRLFIIKYNSSGTLQWQKYITVSGGSTTSPAIDAEGTALYTIYNLNGVVYIAKYDFNGTRLWMNRFNNLGSPVGAISGNYIKEVDSGNAILVCFQGVYGRYVCKLPADGSGTGTYGNITYSSTTLTEATSGLTEVAFTTTSTPVGAAIFQAALAPQLTDYNSSYEVL